MRGVRPAPEGPDGDLRHCTAAWPAPTCQWRPWPRRQQVARRRWRHRPDCSRGSWCCWSRCCVEMDGIPCELDFAWPQCTFAVTCCICCRMLSCSAVWHSAAHEVPVAHGLQLAGLGPHTCTWRSPACAGCQQGMEGPRGADEAARTAAAGRQRAAMQQRQGVRTAWFVRRAIFRLAMVEASCCVIQPRLI